MIGTQQKAAAKKFAEDWKERGYEKGESQPFWLSLLRNVYGIEEPEQFITFEDQVRIDHTSFIDGMIPATHVLIEQKGLGKDLGKPIKQSDGTLLTPFQQAKRYSAELPYSERPRWIVTCNFSEFWIYDMQNPGGEPEKLQLADLEKEYYRLSFLIDTGNEHIKREMEVSMQAGEIVGVLYDKLLAQYKNPESEDSLKSLNMLCVRLVFCLYAEDAEIFGRHGMFHDYLQRFEARDMRRALIELFQTLDQVPEKRDPYMDEELAAFPYVNGGLFSDEAIEIPNMTEEIRALLLEKASEDFDWSEISPTIFGAVFESTLNPETRRKGGMHYTSIENIHKVIDPLFLDNLKNELDEIKRIKSKKKGKGKGSEKKKDEREKALEEFQIKLSELSFLDPACGSGNFLTETYISLRRLENEVFSQLYGDQIAMGMVAQLNPIKVSISQFYGIEINDFAVTVAKTALWIAESQMMKETEAVVHMRLDFLPLKSYANIIEGNALRVDWESIVSKSNLNYIMGNPPFIGKKEQSKEQKCELMDIWGKRQGTSSLDYVTGWYKKAVEFMQGQKCRAAFVSTNSITQGEQVPVIWNLLFDMGVHLDFAYRPFRWDSEAKIKAQVHCVIIGFSVGLNIKESILFTSERAQIVENINGYLIAGPNVAIDSRNKPLCAVPNVVFGSMPNDGGYLSNYSGEQRREILSNFPEAHSLFKRFLGASEFINKRERWCLWLKDVSPSIIKKVPPVMQAVSEVKLMRENSPRVATQKLAEIPTLFGEIRQPDTEYIIIPRHSSQNRKYIPMDFVTPDVICGDANLLLPQATLYHFGIMMSNVHNAWVKTVCGRIKSDFRYSIQIVYNNFPWPQPTASQKEKIQIAAQKILNARDSYPDSSLADLYDDIAMPPELRKAHRANDRAVMQAYGFNTKMMESECVAELMKLYEKITEQL